MKEEGTMKWIISDAITLALDMRAEGQIAPDQLEETVNTLWAEMAAENEENRA